MTPRVQGAILATLLVTPLVTPFITPLVTTPVAAQERPDRAHPPALGPAPQLNLAPIQKRTLSNGLAVWVIETRKVPLVQVSLVVRAGSGDDPAGRYGAASMTAAMLDEGAGTRSALDLADAVDFLGADLTTGSSFDASVVRLNVPVAGLAAALPLMADVALRPTFPEMDLERVRQQRLTALLQARDEPQAIAPRALQRIVFGSAHRYGTSANGTEATLKAMTSADLRAFHARFYQPPNATLILVGDVHTDAVMPALEQNFGGWRNTGPVARTPVPTAPQLTRGQIYLVDKPGAAQSVIQLGWVGTARSTPDFFRLEVLNTILGGSFSSRLNQNLREEHGYAYGAGSGFDMRLSAGTFIAGAAVQTDKTADALREFLKELTGISTPIGDEELSRGKNYVALGFPAQFETIGSLSRQIEDLVVYGLPDDYYQRYVPQILGVTAADVQKAAAAYIQPSRLAIVIVGDRKTIEPAVRALALPQPVRVMTIEEALGP